MQLTTVQQWKYRVVRKNESINQHPKALCIRQKALIFHSVQLTTVQQWKYRDEERIYQSTPIFDRCTRVQLGTNFAVENEITMELSVKNFCHYL